MSRRTLEHRRRGLKEIRDVMGSVKSLAYIETRKLGRVMSAQREISAQVRHAAADLLSFYPEILPAAAPAAHILIAVGTERGFCGDFNQRILAEIARRRAEAAADALHIVAIGHKLESLLEARAVKLGRTSFIAGANVAQEVPSVLDRIVAAIDTLRQSVDVVGVSGIYLNGRGELEERHVLPPFEECRNTPQEHAHPPILNLPPARVMLDLAEHYLLACLHEILYTSLLAENQSRVSHLTDAVNHLDEKLASLAHRSNALRQEEITEEIEVILLNTAEAGSGPMPS
jgi:F-type H+-transporting ATPase subunit gamma